LSRNFRFDFRGPFVSSSIGPAVMRPSRHLPNAGHLDYGLGFA